jgi:hypothetical protein
MWACSNHGLVFDMQPISKCFLPCYDTCFLPCPGSDTTSSTLSFLLYELARHPGAQQRAAAEVEAALGGKQPGEPGRNVLQDKGL